MSGIGVLCAGVAMEQFFWLIKLNVLGKVSLSVREGFWKNKNAFQNNGIKMYLQTFARQKRYYIDTTFRSATLLKRDSDADGFL